MFRKGLNIKSWYIVILLLFGYSILIFLNNKFILTEDLYHYSLGEQLTIERIEQLFLFQSNLEWISYVIISLSLIIKLSLITIALYTGVILSNLKVKLVSLFHIVLQAELLFLFAFSVKIYWLYFFMPDISLTTLGFFSPLSIINFYTINEIPSWLVYPLQLVNLFEAGYWLLLAYLLMEIIKKSFWKSLEFVLSTYGMGLLIWVVLVVFLTLNFS